MTKTVYQGVQGIWSPAAQAHTYIVCEEFASYKEAKRWATREAKSGDQTLVILECKTKVMWRASSPAPSLEE